VLFCTLLFCTLLHCTILHCTLLYCNVQRFTLLCCTYCTLLYCTLLCCTLLYCTLLYCAALYCTLLTVVYFTVLYCTLLYYSRRVSTQLHLTKYINNADFVDLVLILYNFKIRIVTVLVLFTPHTISYMVFGHAYGLLLCCTGLRTEIHWVGTYRLYTNKQTKTTVDMSHSILRFRKVDCLIGSFMLFVCFKSISHTAAPTPEVRAYA